MRQALKFAVRLACALLMFAIPLASSAGEQKRPEKPRRGVADVPYDFMTLDTRMPAGRYSVTTVGSGQLFVRNENDPRIAAQVFTSPEARDAVPDEGAKLIFIERDGKNYLVGIINADGFHRVSGLIGANRKDGDVRKEVALVYE